VFKVLQPAIRYTKAECLDLPDVLYSTRDIPLTPQQEKYYKQLKLESFTQAAGEEITAVTAAVRLTKLLQVSCLTGDTNVLCRNGWKYLRDVTISDQVWDGIEWVNHQGLIYQGSKQVITLDGVRMTADHKVLTDSGWVTAGEILNGESSIRYNRAKVWIPNSYGTSGNDSGHSNAVRTVEMQMRLWEHSNSQKPISSNETSNKPTKLRVPPWQRAAPHDFYSTLSYLAWNATKVYESNIQRLRKIWWTGHHCMRSMAGFVSRFLDRYASGLFRNIITGSNKCQSRIFSRKLSMGYSKTTGKQYEIQSINPNTARTNDDIGSSGCVWTKNGNLTCKDNSLQMGYRDGATNPCEAVYDLLNCGPRNRFVVQKDKGDPFIVHNCGSIYSDTGEVVEFDVSNRMTALKDIIQEASHKVLVFCPFRHSIDNIVKALQDDGISCEEIHGDVSAGKRAAVFKRFQESPDPQVLVIQPQAASHGVTLHAANVVVFWSPVMSVETYIQCCARVDRAGQRNPMTVFHLQGSPVEKKIYNMLQNKIDIHQKLVDLYMEEQD